MTRCCCCCCVRLVDRLALAGTQLLAACTRKACILILASSCTSAHGTASPSASSSTTIVMSAAGTSRLGRCCLQRILLEAEMAASLLAAARRLGRLRRIEGEVFPFPCGWRRCAGLTAGQQRRCGRRFSGQYGQAGLLALKLQSDRDEQGRERERERRYSPRCYPADSYRVVGDNASSWSAPSLCRRPRAPNRFEWPSAVAPPVS